MQQVGVISNISNVISLLLDFQRLAQEHRIIDVLDIKVKCVGQTKLLVLCKACTASLLPSPSPRNAHCLNVSIGSLECHAVCLDESFFL